MKGEKRCELRSAFCKRSPKRMKIEDAPLCMVASLLLKVSKRFVFIV